MRGRMRGRGRGHLGGEREGGRKWAVSLDPLLKSLSLPLLLFFFFGITVPVEHFSNTYLLNLSLAIFLHLFLWNKSFIFVKTDLFNGSFATFLYFFISSEQMI